MSMAEKKDNGGVTVINPYKRATTFVGGAEQARKKARKRRATPIMTPMEKQRLSTVLPVNMNSFERFSASVLRTSPADLVASENDSNKARAVWKEICARVQLETPSDPIRAEYEDARVHFAVRAALVLEEARCAVAQPLASRWSQTRLSGNQSGLSMHVTAHYSEKNNSNGHARVTFRKSSPFTKDELFHIRPGAVFQCIPRDSARTLNDVVLGMITSGGNRDSSEQKKDFSITLFRDIPRRLDGHEFVLSPLQTLISELRCFEAMSMNPRQIPFLDDLMGRKAKKHQRFGSEDENDSNNVKVASKKKDPTISEFFQPAMDKSHNFTLPTLNHTQEKAARGFLNSPPSTVNLVQGPPGTGKTTLLVSTICRYLMQNKTSKRQLLVCAPTNKAVTVLANRFMLAMKTDGFQYRPLMVGDADKLLAEDRTNKDNILRPIFVFSWMQSVTDDYRTIRNYFQPQAGRGNAGRRRSPTELHRLACRTEKRIQSYLDGTYPEIDQGAAKVKRAMAKIVAGDGEDIVSTLNKLIILLESIQKEQPDGVWRQLISTADVLFCTLASAGGLIFRNHSVSDLIVDEAAAATEPELCIPLHMRPSRMLCVGDPLQLPATVLSRAAVQLGLAESLHERLMYRCNHEYTMLDVQYRMKPQIAEFPSFRFYDSKINNGDNVQSTSYAGAAKLLDGSPYTFLETQGAEEQGPGGSYRNNLEARCVVDLIKQLRQASGGNYRSDQSSNSWYSASKVRVITFYQAQVSLLKRLLRELGLADKVVVATVDSSQGCEADIVIVSFVRSRPKPGASGRYAAGFLTDDRRMNVALTRAKYQLICVGNVNGLSQMAGADTLQLLAKDAVERSVVKSSSGSQQGNKKSDLDSRLDDFYGN